VSDDNACYRGKSHNEVWCRKSRSCDHSFKYEANPKQYL